MMPDLNDAILLIGPDESNDSGTMGTGFVIWVGESATYILTCRHVVKGIQGSDGINNIMAKNIVLEDIIPDVPLIFDISLLTARHKWDCVPLILDEDFSVESGEPIYCIGFFQVAGEEVHADALNLPRTVRGTINEEPKRRQVPYSEHSPLIISFEIHGKDIHEEGFSGAPLLRKSNNSVIGIVLYKEGNEGHAVSIQELWKVWPDISTILGQESAPSENLHEVENSPTQAVKSTNEILYMVTAIPSRYSKPYKISFLRKQIQEDISILEDHESMIMARYHKDKNREESISADIQVTIDLVGFLLELLRNAIDQFQKNQGIQNPIIKEIHKLSLEYFINIQAEEANMDDDKIPFLVARLIQIYDPLKQGQIDVEVWDRQLSDFDIIDLLGVGNILSALHQLTDSSTELMKILESSTLAGTFPRMSYQKHNIAINLFNIEKLSQDATGYYKKLQEDFLNKSTKGLIASCLDELENHLAPTLHWLRQIIHWLDTSEQIFTP